MLTDWFYYVTVFECIRINHPYAAFCFWDEHTIEAVYAGVFRFVIGLSNQNYGDNKVLKIYGYDANRCDYFWKFNFGGISFTLMHTRSHIYISVDATRWLVH